MIAEQSIPWLEDLDHRGEPRADWADVLHFANITPHRELCHLENLLAQRMREQAITYVPHGQSSHASATDGEALGPNWRLDPLPMVLGSNDWHSLEQGIKQRATLWEHLLNDCYGAQRCVNDGSLPARLLASHPGFLRPCHGWKPVGEQRLITYAADCVRAANGQWQVVADHSQGLSGLGYALENRSVVARALPELFAHSRVMRLGPFFDHLKKSLEHLASSNESASIALLSDGSEAEQSFEQAYLARYLGYDVISGRDLTVRGSQVLIKTLGGLKRVDVLLRRLPDHLCDPLHLDGHGSGPAGLLRACAQQGVAMANGLGCGLIQAPALMAFLPTLCRSLLSQDLLLSSLDTWWCGDAAQRARLADLNQPAAGWFINHRSNRHLSPAGLASADWDSARQNIQQHPTEWTYCAPCLASRAPSWRDGILAHRSVALRLFAVQLDGQWTVMPGALSHVLGNELPRPGHLLQPDGAKDTWVVNSADHLELPPPVTLSDPIALRRGGVDVPSLLLDDLFWLGRYVERAESIARIVRCALNLHSDQRDLDTKPARNACLTILTAIGAFDEECTEIDDAALLSPLIDDGLSDSLCQVLQRIATLAGQVRSRLSRDAWRSIFELIALMDRATIDSDRRVNSGIALCDQVIDRCAALSGALAENSVRGHAWTFLDLGRRLERAINTVLVLQQSVGPDSSRTHLEMALDIADSLLTYRARYRGRLQPGPMVDLLFSDDSNPRSLLFQLQAMQRRFAALPRDHDLVGPWPAQATAISLTARVMSSDVLSLCADDGEHLNVVLAELLEQLWDCSQQVALTWFSHALTQTSRQARSWLLEEKADHAQ